MTKIKVDTNVFGQLTSLNILNPPIIANTSASSEIDIDDSDANIAKSIKQSQNEASDLITNILLQKLNKATYDGFISLTLQSSYSIVPYSTKLTIPPVYDFTETVDANMFFRNTIHSFYEGYPADIAEFTYGTNESSFGIGVIKFKRGNPISLKIHNQTKNYLNIHWHGMNVDPYNDGASGENMFGPDTKIGPVFELNEDKLTNNGCVMWVHPHPMFDTLKYVYLGLVGLVIMEDEVSKPVDDYFVYGDNHVPIIIGTIGFNDNGTISFDNLVGFQLDRYSQINGTSCLSWLSNEDTNKNYINTLYHETSSNLVKFTVLNGSCTFSIYCIGICDKYDNIKFFNLISTDQGYRNPLLLLDNAYISPGERISILFDLNDFQDNEAYLFFYNVIANEGGNNYATITNEIKKFIIKNKCLKITYNDNHDSSKDYNLISVLTDIQKLVFGSNYEAFINAPELDKLNYTAYLNTDYYYNIPNIKEVAILDKRSFLFMVDSKNGSYANGSTEYCEFTDISVDRVWSSMWTDYEYEMYQKTGDNYFLPTCLFFISKYSGDYLEYVNYREQDNHELVINIYKDESLSEVYKTVDISFSETDKPMNVRIWMEFVESYFSSTYFLDDDDNKVYISDIIDYYWEPYTYVYTEGSITANILTIKMFIQNKTEYYVELKGRWTLLTFFGKPFRGNFGFGSQNPGYTLDPNMPMNMMVAAGSRDGTFQFVDEDDDFFSIVVYPNELYCGFADGWNNDNFRVFSVQKEITEKWEYNNCTNDFHPIHFHNTSAFVDYFDNFDNQGYTLSTLDRLTYSKDVYPLQIFSRLILRLKFPTNTSDLGKIKHLGYMIHCHYLDHHDMNMMNQFNVFVNKSDYFY